MAADKGYPPVKCSTLALGWTVSVQLEPNYWISGGKLGEHSPERDLVHAKTEEMARHAIIVAQSGSGKSFFLGRLIEELLMMSRSRLVIIDPNADFRKIADPAPEAFWTEAGYGNGKKGYLPTERTQGDFVRRWNDISKVVYLVGMESADWHHSLQIDWIDLSVDWLFGDADHVLRNELHHCHSFVAIVAALLKSERPNADKPAIEDLDFVKQLCEQSVGKTRRAITKLLERKMPKKKRGNTSAKKDSRQANYDETPGSSAGNAYWREIAIDRAAINLSFVSKETARYYFCLAYARRESELINLRLTKPAEYLDRKVQVVDLPSIDDQMDRMMVVNTFIEREWKRARELWTRAVNKRGNEPDERSPTFIVVDEAHNLVFSHPNGFAQRRLQELFRMIAAEGRKYGVFLILVTQRPDKIDPFVVSEVENRAIMRIGSKVVLEKTIELLGLNAQAASWAESCLHFGTGRALMIGPWAPKSERPFLYAATRRTAEGGKNLDEKYWAVEP